MDSATWLGIGWGLLAAAVQYFHIVRSVRKQLKSRSPLPIGKSLWGSLVRMALLATLFLVAAFWEALRIEAAIVTFAVCHLIGMLLLGVRFSAGNRESTK